MLMETGFKGENARKYSFFLLKKRENVRKSSFLFFGYGILFNVNIEEVETINLNHGNNLNGENI
jgi:hypothetical protein